jgi:hypothetical protein
VDWSPTVGWCRTTRPTSSSASGSSRFRSIGVSSWEAIRATSRRLTLCVACSRGSNGCDHDRPSCSSTCRATSSCAASLGAEAAKAAKADTGEAIACRQELDDAARAPVLDAMAEWADVVHVGGDRPLEAVAEQILNDVRCATSDSLAARSTRS